MVLTLIQACRNAFNASRRHETPPGHTCLTFTVSGILFGIRTNTIREIVRCGILAVPRDKPRFLRGFYRHGGVMLPIIDLAKRYSTHATDIGGRTCIVVVEMGRGRQRQPVGVLVDEVHGLAELQAEDLKPLRKTVVRMLNVNVVQGMVKLAKDYLIVLDVQRLLSPEETEALLNYSRG